MADTRHLPVTSTANWDWQLRASCRSMPDNAFFHPDGERGADRALREQQAKAVCAECPVRRECLAHALTAREPYGIWGGLGETERHRLLTRSNGEDVGNATVPLPRSGSEVRTGHSAHHP